MHLREHVPFSALTTFKIGGAARYVATCESIEDIQTALAFIRERGLSWYVLGGGSNLLVSDEGYDGLVMHLKIGGVSFRDDETGSVVATAGAGVVWDSFVQETVEKGLWGIENLAGIPGTVGASPVQNIGAYGAETADTLLSVEVFDTVMNEVKTFTRDECRFGYRESYFKHDSSLVITGVSFTLSKDPNPRITYADLAAKEAEGMVLDTPLRIANAVRDIRAQKFPDLSRTGTAGSFFKNPVIAKEAYEELKGRYPAFPGFIAEGGVKISLAWILDNVLRLRGFSRGNVRLFEKQPLVIVAEQGATYAEVDALANDVAQKVFDATGIVIEREVRTLLRND